MFICKLDQQRKNWRITRKLIVSKAAVPSECCYTTMQLLPLRYKNHLCSQTERLLFSLRCRLHKSCRFVFCHSAGHFPRQHILVGAKKLHFLDSKIQAQMNWYFNNDAKLSPLLKIQLKGALLVFLLYTLPLSSPLSCMMPCEPGQVGHSCTSISMIQGGFLTVIFNQKTTLYQGRMYYILPPNKLKESTEERPCHICEELSASDCSSGELVEGICGCQVSSAGAKKYVFLISILCKEQGS